MATESERKRFHLEDIIRQISEETVSTATSGITSISSGELFGKEDICGNEKRDFEEDSSDGIKSVESLSEEENLNDKDSSADEVIVQSKISPRCDVCGLLHFKSYRCVTRVSSPAYIRQAFDDNYHKLRVCRKCLTSKENCIENVAISNLSRYSDKIRQMKIPLGMTSNRRTKPFELVVRNLQHIKFSDFHRPDDLQCFQEFDSYSSIVDNTSQTSRKTLLQRFHMDDPIQKNLFLKELNLCSTEMLKNVASKEEISERPNGNIEMEKSQPMHKDIKPVFNHSEDVRSLYHVAAKNVVSSNIPEKKLGEGAVKCVNRDLVVSTKRAWKPNKKYDNLRKVGNPNVKKLLKNCDTGKTTGKTTGDSPEKSRTCGINCAVCNNHVQKSYSCCTLQNAPEKFKHLFTPGVVRLKICRKCSPYKKIIKPDEHPVVKKKVKVKQKRGRKPTKVVKPSTGAREIPKNFRVKHEESRGLLEPARINSIALTPTFQQKASDYIHNSSTTSPLENMDQN